MKKLMKVFLLSCKKASELIEKKSVVSLSVKENIKLKLHTSMCKACNAYENQSKTLDQALQEFTNTKKQNRVTLSEEARAHILHNLRKK